MNVRGIDHDCVKRPFLASDVTALGRKQEQSNSSLSQIRPDSGSCKALLSPGISLFPIGQDLSEEGAVYELTGRCLDSFDLKQATREGWTIEYNSDVGGSLRGIGRSDMDIWWHVARSAARGSVYHCAALAELTNDERLAIEVHCGPTGIPLL